MYIHGNGPKFLWSVVVGIKPQLVSPINTALERALSSNPNNGCNLREWAKDSYTIKEDVKYSFEEVAENKGKTKRQKSPGG